MIILEAVVEAEESRDFEVKSARFIYTGMSSHSWGRGGEGRGGEGEGRGGGGEGRGSFEQYIRSEPLCAPF